MQTQTPPQRQTKPTTATDVVCVADKPMSETVFFAGKARIYSESSKGATSFTLSKTITPGSSVKDTIWEVETHTESEDPLDPSLDGIIRHTVIRHCMLNGERTGNQTDVLYIDEKVLKRRQVFCAWIALGGKDYEIDIIKTSNGTTSFEFSVVSECDEPMRKMIEDTMRWYVQRNPVGQIFTQPQQN